MESVIIRGIAADQSQAKVTLRAVPDKPGVAAGIFKALAAANLNVDMIVQNMSEDGRTDLSFTLPADDLHKAQAVLDPIMKKAKAADVHFDTGIAKVSIVGVGMKSHSGVAFKMFDILAANKINIEMISTSEIKISVVIRSADADRAVRALHDTFGLSRKPKAKAPAKKAKAPAKKRG